MVQIGTQSCTSTIQFQHQTEPEAILYNRSVYLVLDETLAPLAVWNLAQSGQD